jgi:preprotein translocase subunit YajC
MHINSLLLQAATQGGGGIFGQGIGGMIVFPLMIVVMYFFFIAPQSKRAKQQKKFSESINVGDQIVTTAGIHGRINKSNDDGTIQLEISRTTFMTIERSAISMEMTTAYRKKVETGTAVATTSVK